MAPIFATHYRRGILSTRVEVFENRIRITRGKKDIREIPIEDIRSVHHYSAPSRYDVYPCFWIDAGATRAYIQGSERTSSMLGDGPFQRSVIAVLNLLARKRPDVQFSHRAGAGVEWTYFLMGVVFGAPAAVLGAILTFKAPLVGLPVVVLGLSFSAFGFAFRPWRSRIGVPVKDFRDAYLAERERERADGNDQAGLVMGANT